MAYFERAPQTLNWGPRTVGEICQRMQKAQKPVFVALESRAKLVKDKNLAQMKDLTKAFDCFDKNGDGQVDVADVIVVGTFVGYLQKP